MTRDFYRAREQDLRYSAATRGRPSGDYGDAYSWSRPDYGRNYSDVERDRQRPWRSEPQRRGPQWYDNPSSGQRGSPCVNTGGYGYDYASYARSQSFRGRGPQGYQRSDDRLKEIICERLTDDPGIDASNVTIEVTGQIVKLTGTVDDRGTKYEIEELIESFGGVKDIDNQLRVQQPSFGGQSGQQLRGGNDWEAGSSSSSSSGSASRTSSTGASTTSGSSTSPSKRN